MEAACVLAAATGLATGPLTQKLRRTGLGAGESAALAAVIATCLEPAPADRYGSASELESDLGRWLAGEPVAARPLPLSESLIRLARRHRAAAVATAAVGAALVVAVLVIGAAVTLIRSNVGSLMDQAPAGLVELAQEAIDEVEPPVEIRRLRVREAGGTTFVDGVLEVEADAPVQQGHELADRVEAALHRRIADSDVTIHIEPREGAELRERVTGAALSAQHVREVHNVRIVSIDGRTDLSLHVKLPAGQSLSEAHATIDHVEAAIRAAAPEIDAVHVHIEPLEPSLQAPITASEESAELSRSKGAFGSTFDFL